MASDVQIDVSGENVPHSNAPLGDVLRTESLTKHYDGVHALEDANFEIRRGEPVAIMGDNGASKSTFVRQIIAVEQRTRWRIWFGRDVNFEGPLEAREAGIETVFQALVLSDHLDVPDNLFLGREKLLLNLGPFSILDYKGMRKAAMQRLEKPGVKIPNLSNTIQHMSGGQRQCVAIARTTAFHSKLTVADEPTAALGLQETAQVERIIRNAEGGGRAAAPHQPQQAAGDGPLRPDRRVPAQPLRPYRSSMSITINLRLLGAGRVGKVHVQAIAATDGARLVAMADAVDAAHALAGKYGANVRTIEEIEAAGDIDAVVICTPTETHADLIERFARTGRSTFCETPVDLSVARVVDRVAVVEETGATLMVGLNRRFDPNFRARDHGPPPCDYFEPWGGIFRDMTIHDFDVARWLLGKEMEEVQAAASVLVDPEIRRRADYGSVNVILTTASGRHCTITNSRRATCGHDQRIEVPGSSGAIAAENVRLSRTMLATDGFVGPPLLDFFMTRDTDAYAAEIAAVVGALRDGGTPRTAGHDGLTTLALADAALRWVDEARVVEVAEVLR